MSKRKLTNEQEAISQLYSVLVAIVHSDRTPKHTAEATIQTLEKLFNDENGPFQASDTMIGMTMAMGEAMNDIVKQRNKQIERVAEGNSILGDINWN
jgi:uncharacterized protein (UPF0147 family)